MCFVTRYSIPWVISAAHEQGTGCSAACSGQLPHASAWLHCPWAWAKRRGAPAGPSRHFIAAQHGAGVASGSANEGWHMRMTACTVPEVEPRCMAIKTCMHTCMTSTHDSWSPFAAAGGVGVERPAHMSLVQTMQAKTHCRLLCRRWMKSQRRQLPSCRMHTPRAG